MLRKIVNTITNIEFILHLYILKIILYINKIYIIFEYFYSIIRSIFRFDYFLYH